MSTSLPYENFFYESKLSVYYSEEILNIINKIVEKSDESSSINSIQLKQSYITDDDNDFYIEENLSSFKI